MTPGGHPAVGVDPRPRLSERHVLALSLAVCGGFVVAAVIAAGWAAVTAGATWAALHLSLAGAATVAIGAFMPHFAVTLAGTRPAPPVRRLATIALLAAGSASVVLGVFAGSRPLSATGTALVLLGLAGVAVQTLAPLREPLARRHPLVTAAYGIALLELAVGVLIGGLGAVGVPAIVSAWAAYRPAHAWLTLFGAISLTIFATLVYLAPTIFGARIRNGWALVMALVGIGIGPIMVAAAFALDLRAVVVAGMGITAAGAVGQVAYVLDSRRRRGPYTSEHDWRSVVTGHLLAGPWWFAAAVTVALVELALGRGVGSWSLGLLATPMIAGWMLQGLVGSWTHLVPAVTPGDPAAHARQRRILAAGSRSRLIAWNGGVALLWGGLAIGLPVVATSGGVMLVAAVIGSSILLARALAQAPIPLGPR